MASNFNHQTDAQLQRSTSTIQGEPLDVLASQYSFHGGKKIPAYGMLLDNVLSVEECKAWAEIAERAGYEDALVNVGNGVQIPIPDLRHCQRAIIDNEQMSGLLFHRIKEYLPQHYGPLQKVGHDGSLIELNERLRFLKYNPGDFFKPHYDGNYEREDRSAISHLTVMVYLNDSNDFEGGETQLYHPSTGRDALKTHYSIQPKPGRVLIFDHRVFHAGQVVKSGTKLCIRTDVMYSKPQTIIQQGG